VADITWILLFFILYLWPSQRYCATHHVDIVFNRCVEFFQPEITLHINIKETLYYHASYTTQQHPQYNSILFSSPLLSVAQFIAEHHWSAGSSIKTTNMGIYFTRIFFESIGQASKNLFFFEVLNRIFPEVEFFLLKYFTKYYNWEKHEYIADNFNVAQGGFMKKSYSFDEVIAVSGVIKNTYSPLKIFFFERPIVYLTPPPYWTCFVNRQFSCNNINYFDSAPRSQGYFYKNPRHSDKSA
jgi:hypothetical protein